LPIMPWAENHWNLDYNFIKLTDIRSEPCLKASTVIFANIPPELNLLVDEGLTKVVPSTTYVTLWVYILFFF